MQFLEGLFTMISNTYNCKGHLPKGISKPLNSAITFSSISSDPNKHPKWVLSFSS